MDCDFHSSRVILAFFTMETPQCRMHQKLQIPPPHSPPHSLCCTLEQTSFTLTVHTDFFSPMWIRKEPAWLRYNNCRPVQKLIHLRITQTQAKTCGLSPEQRFKFTILSQFFLLFFLPSWGNRVHWKGSVALLQCIMKWYYENEIIFFCQNHVLVSVKWGGYCGLSVAYDPRGTY